MDVFLFHQDLFIAFLSQVLELLRLVRDSVVLVLNHLCHLLTAQSAAGELLCEVERVPCLLRVIFFVLSLFNRAQATHLFRGRRGRGDCRWVCKLLLIREGPPWLSLSTSWSGLGDT